MVYLYLSVAFIQMLKALTPFYILLCCIAFGMEKPSCRIAASIIVRGAMAYIRLAPQSLAASPVERSEIK